MYGRDNHQKKSSLAQLPLYSYKCVVCLNSIKLVGNRVADYQTLGCEHKLCKDCDRYKKNNCNNSNPYERIQCPQPDCPEYYHTCRIVNELFSAEECEDWWRTAILKAHVSYKVCIQYIALKLMYFLIMTYYYVFYII